MKEPPSFARADEALWYDEATGEFIWLRGRRRGHRAGTLTKDGRWAIVIDGRWCYAHQLAWLWMTGEWPNQQVDHINTNPLDNSFANLRLATGSQNSFNYTVNPRNISGARGVFFDIRYKKPWRAVLARTVIGRYATKKEASEAYRKAAARIYGEFHRT